MVADSGQEHELEGQSREVVMEEEDPGQEEVGGIVHSPPHQQHTPTRAPVHEGICVCVCVHVCVCVW